MTDARDLRRKAALCRRAASIQTDGGTRTDRCLIGLAEKLERQADAIDRKNNKEINLSRLRRDAALARLAIKRMRARLEGADHALHCLVEEDFDDLLQHA
jgi:hypothetical protein